jgi:hypothetical protein
VLHVQVVGVFVRFRANNPFKTWLELSPTEKNLVAHPHKF